MASLNAVWVGCVAVLFLFTVSVWSCMALCGVLCGMRGINFESGQVFFVRCWCVRVIERVGGAGLKGSLWTLGIERLSKKKLLLKMDADYVRNM